MAQNMGGLYNIMSTWVDLWVLSKIYCSGVDLHHLCFSSLSIQTDNNDKFEHFPFRKGPIFRCLKDYAEQLPRGDVKPVHYFCSGDKQ